MPETEAILFAKNAQLLIGCLILCVIQPPRFKRDGTLSPSRGPPLNTLINLLRQKEQHEDVYIESILANGNEIAIKLICGLQSVIVAFSLGLGAAFQVVRKQELTKYPYATYRKGKRIIQRTHLFFEFKDSDLIWILVDCLSFKNFAQWRIYRNTNWHQGIWIGGPDPINYPTAWMNKTLAYLMLNWKMVQNWSVARFLTAKELWNGLGAYNLSEVCWLVARHDKYLPWKTLGELMAADKFSPLSATALPELVLKIASTFRIYHKQTAAYWCHYDLSQHLRPLLARFAKYHLRVYRKPWAQYYSFKGIGGKHHIYIDASMIPKDIKQLGPVEEAWTLGIRPKTWRFDELGVGPLAWHSKTDIKIINMGAKAGQFLQELDTSSIAEDSDDSDFEMDIPPSNIPIDLNDNPPDIPNKEDVVSVREELSDSETEEYNAEVNMDEIFMQRKTQIITVDLTTFQLAEPVLDLNEAEPDNSNCASAQPESNNSNSTSAEPASGPSASNKRKRTYISKAKQKRSKTRPQKEGRNRMYLPKIQKEDLKTLMKEKQVEAPFDNPDAWPKPITTEAELIQSFAN
mmetsp:Transcript_5094/g.7177  ORF Transcript_5094/g.7177 Transcript_5094/m.7177 type:complete len:574 (+) Transcript_5094:133-1854(+)|eukprot:CAMPEP_0168554676 /NCGR_PEP_ID=MMETSP0413-20121227/7911_1 /TAXON_ID=136452 /ORGANISM="Filamoeba nolandi, Strain NC-AS-23-1" /LENGTH=573 /DNA_ID=CAMNT_0008585441 /DNA_START=368 /DNA_END=2086 /DNA_ORIENTATION=+